MLVRGKLVELQPNRKSEREVTLYVKGFLGRGEKPGHFDRWLEAGLDEKGVHHRGALEIPLTANSRRYSVARREGLKPPLGRT